MDKNVHEEEDYSRFEVQVAKRAVSYLQRSVTRRRVTTEEERVRRAGCVLRICEGREVWKIAKF
jgi:hypothetical protein